MDVYLVEFTRRWQDSETREPVGVFDTQDRAQAAVPFPVAWRTVSAVRGTYTATDHNGDRWDIHRLQMNAPIGATFPTWKRENQ